MRLRGISGETPHKHKAPLGVSTGGTMVLGRFITRSAMTAPGPEGYVQCGNYNRYGPRMEPPTPPSTSRTVVA